MADSVDDISVSNKKERVPWSEASLGFLFLRLWIGFRLLFAGLDKFMDFKTGEWSMEYYNNKMEAISGLIKENSLVLNNIPGLGENSKLIEFFFDLYSKSLGWGLLIIGATLILGIFTRLSLVAAGFLFLTLSIGLMMLPDDDGIAYLGIHVGLVAAALIMSRHSKLNLTPW
ncbi:MAG: hypothetical protein AAF514_23830 [Verrucomicrobiota bacterium]